MQPASWTGLRLPIPGQAVEVFTQELVNGARNFLELVPLGPLCPLSGAITSLSRLGSTVVWSDSEVRCPRETMMGPRGKENIRYPDAILQCVPRTCLDAHQLQH